MHINAFPIAEMRRPPYAAAMSERFKIAMLLVMPLVVFAVLVGVDRIFGGVARGGGYHLRLDVPHGEKVVDLPRVMGPPDASRPLLVIDPGHGGHDPGAGQGELREKDLTLLLAKAVRDELLSQGGVRVALTRDDDRYLLLTERAQIARRLNADLFISIHADSGENDQASGATLYTLSDKGSSEIAARLAERENQADKVNGVALADQSDNVNAILVDLSQREAQARALEFSQLFVRESWRRVTLRPEPLQSAAFVVLKSPDMPSVLLEAGYISNSGDSAWMFSDDGRKTFAQVTSKAVRAYFARQAQ